MDGRISVSITETITGLTFGVISCDSAKIILFNNETNTMYSGGFAAWRKHARWEEIKRELIDCKNVILRFDYANIILMMSISHINVRMSLTANMQANIPGIGYDYNLHRHIMIDPAIAGCCGMPDVADEMKNMLAMTQVAKINGYIREKEMRDTIEGLKKELEDQRECIRSITQILGHVQNVVS